MRIWLLVLLVGFATTTQSAGVKVIHVDNHAQPGGNGTGARPFNNIADAVALARAAGGDPTIKVEPGLYELSSPITIDIQLDLVGSNEMEIDSSGWPSGVVRSGTETKIVGLAALGAFPLISVGRRDRVVMNDVNIRGFSMIAGPGGGDDIDFQRVQNFSASNNVLTGPPTVTATNQGVGPVASSGRIVGNYIAGVGAGVVVRAGYPGSPANIEFTGNRSIQNRSGGLLLNGSTFGIPEHGDQLDVLVQGNDLSENTSSEGFGLRIFIIRKDLPDTQSTGNVRALIRGNRLFGNHLGISIDAGFPYRQAPIPPPSGPPVCDTRVYTGTLDVTLVGNTLSGSLLAPGLISFTREQTTLGSIKNPTSAWQYLHNATYIISDPQGSLAGYLKDHPKVDPFVGGLCAADTIQEPLSNTLEYNGEVVFATP